MPGLSFSLQHVPNGQLNGVGSSDGVGIIASAKGNIANAGHGFVTPRTIIGSPALARRQSAAAAAAAAGVADSSSASSKPNDLEETPNAVKKRRRSRKGLEKIFECEIDGCGKRFTRSEHLVRHQLNRKLTLELRKELKC